MAVKKSDIYGYIVNHPRITFNRLTKHFKIKGEVDLKAFQNHLSELEREGKILLEKNEIKIMPRHYHKGRLWINSKGSFFFFDENENRIYLEDSQVSVGLPHDEVIVNEKKEVIKVLSRTNAKYLGHIIEEGRSTLWVSLDNPKVSFKVPSKLAKNLMIGDVVSAYIHDTPRGIQGDIERIVTHLNSPDLDIMLIAYEFGFEESFHPEALEQLKSMTDEIPESEVSSRRDLRDEVIFTIDGADTKDIDDAISLTMKSNHNYLLKVHIADVSHYIKEGTPLYKEAEKRGTSVYLAGSVLPMFPPKLSNHICSLNPNSDRLTLTCEMEIDKCGNIVKYDIYESIINSRKQMTYQNVNEVLNGNSVKGYEEYANTLHLMQNLSKKLTNKHQNQGYLDFDLDEIKIKTDLVTKEIESIDVCVHDKAEKIIENFMLQANECIATHVKWMDLPLPYRIHEKPSTALINEVVEFIAKLGYELNTKTHHVTPNAISNILEELKQYEVYPILSYLLLRSMKKAKYSPDNVGHFGLGINNYTHFTSPIRRFPDFMVHHCLKKYLKLEPKTIDYKRIEKYLQYACQHSSKKEYDAIQAEREVNKLKCAEYMAGHIGETFVCQVTFISGQYLIVETSNKISGKVSVNAIKTDKYYYDEETETLIGRNTHEPICYGDKVEVEVLKACKETRDIEFKITRLLTRHSKPVPRRRIAQPTEIKL